MFGRWFKLSFTLTASEVEYEELLIVITEVLSKIMEVSSGLNWVTIN